jgi:hypothetical protein
MKLKDFIRLLTIAMDTSDWGDKPILFDAVDKANNVLSFSLHYTSMRIEAGHVIIHVEDRL